ncbi:hypothetical protein DMUE_1009 [Dictyocoela muelleri]|nr:hypothetical protein DMUE_1009 [Dictyocoela muelleri]
MKRNIIFFKNIQRDIDNSYLEEIFAIFGKSKIHRIVDRNGNLSDSGFVEFYHEEDNFEMVKNIKNHLSKFGIDTITDNKSVDGEINFSTIDKIKEIFEKYSNFNKNLFLCEEYVNRLIINNHNSYDFLNDIWNYEQKMIQKKYLELEVKYNLNKNDVELYFKKIINNNKND